MLFGFTEDFADNVMCLTKRNSLAHQVIRGFRGQQQRIGSSRAQTLGVEFCSGKRAGSDREHVCNLVMRGKQRFLVFLQVALVAAGQTLQRGEQRKQRTSDAAGFSADQLPRIGVLFLRHQAAAGGIFVGKNHIGKFLRGEHHEILSKAREMRGDAREREKIIEREIAIAHCIEAV